MTDQLWVHINDRGLTRQLDDLWVPHLRIDVIWLTASIDSEVSSAYTERLVPIIEASPVEIVALAAEQHNEGRRAIAVFRSLTDLAEAAAVGFTPQVVNLISLENEPGKRIASSVWLNDDDLDIAQQLISAGFEIIVQPLPNVTSRPLEFASFAYSPDSA